MNIKLKKGLIISGILIGALIIIMIGSSFFVNSSRRQSGGLSYDMAESLDFGSNLGITSKSRSDSYAPSSPRAADTRPLSELTEKKIIKNGSLTIYVRDAEQSAEAIRNLAVAAGGFVAESNIRKSSSGQKTGNITIRVPASSFEEVMGNVKGLAVEVEQENATSQDVTEEYVDLDAQLRNLRAEETQYLMIMQKAYTIEDTLKVANRLSDTRGRIERTQGRLQLLSRQVEMSTIRITLEADADVKVFGLRWRPFIVIKQSSRDLFENLADYVDAMIRFLFQLPVILLWVFTVALMLFIVCRIIRAIYNRMFKKKERKETEQKNIQ